MKYKTVIAIMDGQPDLHGDILTNNVEMPKGVIPVTLDFEGVPIGTATVKLENDRILAEIDVDDTKIPPEMAKYLYGVLGGVIFDKEESVIKKWALKDIGLTVRPCDIRLPTLEELK